MLVHRKITPITIKFDGADLYTSGHEERRYEGKVLFAKYYKAVPHAGLKPKKTRSGFQHTNHYATIPPSNKT